MVFQFLLKAQHSLLAKVGVDMDHVQRWVFDNCPKWSIYNGAVTTAIFLVIWFFVYLALHYVLIPGFLNSKAKQWPSVEHWAKMTPMQKKWYTSYLHGIVHAVFSTMGSYYCFFYADGKPGTTFFNNEEYRNTMFDVQKYLHTFSLGYIIYDLFFCLAVAELDALMIQTFLHHALCLLGNIGGLYIEGFFGSMSQLTWFTEGSTLFVNMRQIFAWHEITKSKLYLYNGLMMLFAFFVFRMTFYSYMVFFGIIPFDFIDSKKNWEKYPEKNDQYFIYFLQFAYLGMYGLNIFWFQKILMGALKALGLVKKSSSKKQDAKVDDAKNK